MSSLLQNKMAIHVTAEIVVFGVAMFVVYRKISSLSESMEERLSTLETTVKEQTKVITLLQSKFNQSQTDNIQYRQSPQYQTLSPQYQTLSPQYQTISPQVPKYQTHMIRQNTQQQNNLQSQQQNNPQSQQQNNPQPQQNVPQQQNNFQSQQHNNPQPQQQNNLQPQQQNNLQPQQQNNHQQTQSFQPQQQTQSFQPQQQTQSFQPQQLDSQIVQTNELDLELADELGELTA